MLVEFAKGWNFRSKCFLKYLIFPQLALYRIWIFAKNHWLAKWSCKITGFVVYSKSINPYKSQKFPKEVPAGLANYVIEVHRKPSTILRPGAHCCTRGLPHLGKSSPGHRQAHEKPRMLPATQQNSAKDCLLGYFSAPQVIKETNGLNECLADSN